MAGWSRPLLLSAGASLVSECCWHCELVWMKTRSGRLLQSSCCRSYSGSKALFPPTDFLSGHVTGSPILSLCSSVSGHAPCPKQPSSAVSCGGEPGLTESQISLVVRDVASAACVPGGSFVGSENANTDLCVESPMFVTSGCCARRLQ